MFFAVFPGTQHPAEGKGQEIVQIEHPVYCKIKIAGNKQEKLTVKAVPKLCPAAKEALPDGIAAVYLVIKQKTDPKAAYLSAFFRKTGTLQSI